MTTFDQNMKLAEQGALPELFEVSAGGYVWRYTTSRTDLTFGGDLYNAVEIKRSVFTVDRELGSIKVTISGYMAEPFVEYVGVSPLASAQITIYRAMADDLTEYAKIATVRVIRVTIKDKIIQAECSAGGPLAAKQPHIVYQAYCNWQVFDCDCGLDYADFEVSATITALSGVHNEILTSTTFGSESDGYWTQGWIRYGADYRFITDHSGNNVYLQIPFGSAVEVSSVVYAVPGCDGTPDTCVNKFDNWTEFCGMPYIPTRNPVIWGMI